MGLREEKKQRVRASIMANAVAMFRESGFEAVRVQQIAARADISDATFFNYFPSKEMVLSEWVHGRLDAALAGACERAGEGGLRRVLRGAVREFAREVEGDLEFQRMAWGRARLAPCRVGGSLPSGRRQSHDALCALLECAVERGELRRDLPVEQLAELLRSALQGSVAPWLTTPAAEPEPLELRLQRGLDLLLDGFHRRHERVRLSTSAHGTATSSSPSSPSEVR